jgi:uncharacterized protein YecE (DUF72 family)
MPEVFIGCSGFNYSHWRGSFYPDGLPQRLWLEHYSTVFASVELNVTFYRLPQPAVFERWRLETPEDFVFALKGSRFITHVKRLKEPEEPLQRFFAAALGLGGKLRAVLWQLPPGFAVNVERLSRFVACLAQYPVRNALEFRDGSWLCQEVLAICRENNISLCLADWPTFLDALPPTADFVYLRRHGHGGDYASRYSTRELTRDAGRIEGHLAEGRDVFIYFNNDALGFAPQNARELAGLLG